MDIYARGLLLNQSVLNDEGALRREIVSLVDAIWAIGGFESVPFNYSLKLKHTEENKDYVELLFDTFDHLAKAKELVESLPLIDQLRFIYRSLMQLHAKVSLEANLTIQFLLLKADDLGAQTYFAVAAVSEMIDRKLKHDWKEILPVLGRDDATDKELLDAHTKLAEDVQLFIDDEKVSLDIKQKFSDYTSLCTDLIADNVSRYANDLLEVMKIEHFIKSAELLEEVFNINVDYSGIKRKYFKDLHNAIQRSSNKRIGRTPGGKREKPNTWNDEMRTQFFLTVERLPRIHGKPMWKAALKHLREKDFDSKALKELAAMSEFAGPARELLREAAKLWQADKTKGKFSPGAYAFKHAIKTLGYPELVHGSAKQYHKEGRTLHQRRSEPTPD
jgi:hypothetical protein